MKLDPDDRMFVASLLLAAAALVMLLARVWAGDLAPAITWLVLALVALAILSDLVFGTRASGRVARWLSGPFKGPAGWRKAR